MMYAFLVGGARAIVEYWLQGGCVDPPEQVAETILSLANQIAF